MICVNVAGVAMLTDDGVVKIGWLNTLKVSMRNWNRCDSLIVNRFWSEMSQFC